MAQNNDEHDQPLSLALRPRGQHNVTAATTTSTTDENDATGNVVVGGRRPFPVSEIEPHYSREPTQVKPSSQNETKAIDEKFEQDSKNNNGKFATLEQLGPILSNHFCCTSVDLKRGKI